ncbi:MAG: cupin domain-containing protein [Actinomycetota bacterium]|nr:cupin domain-containing protein [Actinomycetota bacterium]
MGYAVFRPGELDFADRGDGSGRRLYALSDRLTQTRARFWRYPPGARGRRHAEHVQEELFVVLEGTLTMLLGDPPERAELPRGSVCAVEPGTPLQVRNHGETDLLLLIVGAPPVESGADYFPDVEA